MSNTPVGALLREWRAARRLSQLDLALNVGVSARHLSCIENGKAQPSRDMVSRLADELEMPLRERNALLMAAGFAPRYRETPLGTPELSRVKRAIDFMLELQEPYPAFLMNRHWDVLLFNRAAARVNRYLLGRDSAHTNVMRQFFDPADLRQVIANWEEVAGELIRYLHADMVAAPTGHANRDLLEELLRYPDVPTHWRTRELDLAPSPLLTTVMRRGERELRFFSTITTFATPRDVTLEELRIECCFPDDEPTAAFCRELAESEAATEAESLESPASRK
jgi:transcriptional regulator with XRE-family HTH domain